MAKTVIPPWKSLLKVKDHRVRGDDEDPRYRFHRGPKCSVSHFAKEAEYMTATTFLPNRSFFPCQRSGSIYDFDYFQSIKKSTIRVIFGFWGGH